MKSEFYGTNIFLDNEYTEEYLEICRKALKRGDPGEYYEDHQVVPSGFWPELPNAEKGKLQQAMPTSKRVSCQLSPEDHFRCHYLLTKMFPVDTKAHRTAIFDYIRRNATSPEQYGSKARERNKGKDWANRPEYKKYEGM